MERSSTKLLTSVKFIINYSFGTQFEQHSTMADLNIPVTEANKSSGVKIRTRRKHLGHSWHTVIGVF